MTVHLMALMLVATSVAAAPTGVDVRLTEGAGYPVCVALAAALKQMPPSTDLTNWAEYLPPIRGITRPHWTPLDPLQHMDTIREFTVKVRRIYLDKRSNAAIWADIGPGIEQAARSGQLRLEEVTVPDVKLGVPSEALAERPWTTDVSFLRIGNITSIEGTIGPVRQLEPGSTYTPWAYTAASFSLFPSVHDVPIEDGVPDLNMILVDGQLWFTELWGSIGVPYTNDLADHRSNADHRIYVDQRCTFYFPERQFFTGVKP